MAFIEPFFLQDRQTSGTGKTMMPIGSTKDICITYMGNGTTSGGTVLLEESDDPQYTGTWSLIETVLASSVTGNQKSCHHVRVGAGNYTRARISSAITGSGTITVTASGM